MILFRLGGLTVNFEHVALIFDNTGADTQSLAESGLRLQMRDGSEIPILDVMDAAALRSWLATNAQILE